MTCTDHQAVALLHHQGLLNREIAQRLGVSEATVKRRKRDLGLKSNCPRNTRGSWGEQFVTEQARRRGLDAVWVGYRRVAGRAYPFDVQLGSTRIEVKTATVSDGRWRFRLPKVRPSFHGEGNPTVKDYPQDCDVIACVALGRTPGEEPFIHFLHPAQGLTNLTLRPDALTPAQRDNWTLLAPQAAAQAA